MINYKNYKVKIFIKTESQADEICYNKDETEKIKFIKLKNSVINQIYKRYIYFVKAFSAYNLM